MKKIKLLLSLAFIATFALQSCNTKVEQPSMYALVTVNETSTGFYGKTDKGELVNAGSRERIPTYKPVTGQRSIMYFTPLETPLNGFEYNADVFDMVDILTKEPILLTDTQFDTLGTAAINVTSAWLGEEFLNIEFKVATNYTTNHYINLVDNQLVPTLTPNQDGYLLFDLKHKTKLEEGDATQTAGGMVCFNLADYNIANCNGVILKYKEFKEDGSDDDKIKELKVEKKGDEDKTSFSL